MLTQRQRESLRDALGPFQEAIDSRAQYYRILDPDDMELELRRYNRLQESAKVLTELWEAEEFLCERLQWALHNGKAYPCEHKNGVKIGNVGREYPLILWRCDDCGWKWVLTDDDEVVMGYMWSPAFSKEEDGA